MATFDESEGLVPCAAVELGESVTLGARVVVVPAMSTSMDPLPNFVEKETERRRTLVKRRHSIIGFRVWVGDIVSHGDGNDILCTQNYFQSDCTTMHKINAP